MTVTIDRTYNFIDTWTLSRSQLEALNLGTVIGRGVRGELTLIPFGVSVDECFQKVSALLHPPAQLITQPSTVVLPVIDSSHAQNRTTATVFTGENTVADDVKRLENTIKARAAKTDKDYQRLQAQRSQVRLLLAENPLMSVSSLAQRMGISRPTARKLLNLHGIDEQCIINSADSTSVHQTLTSTQNESGLSSVESRRQPLAAQPIDPTVTVAANYTLSHSSGQPV